MEINHLCVAFVVTIYHFFMVVCATSQVSEFLGRLENISIRIEPNLKLLGVEGIENVLIHDKYLNSFYSDAVLETAYAVLGFANKPATATEAKKAYYKLFREFHPDRNASVEAKRISQLLSAANSVIQQSEKDLVQPDRGYWLVSFVDSSAPQVSKGHDSMPHVSSWEEKATAPHAKLWGKKASAPQVSSWTKKATVPLESKEYYQYYMPLQQEHQLNRAKQRNRLSCCCPYYCCC